MFGDAFSAAGAQLAVAVVGTASTGGTLLIGAAGALAANELYDRLGKGYMEDWAAHYELGAVRNILNEANDSLEKHQLDAAIAGQSRLIGRLRGLENELAEIADRNAADKRDRQNNDPKPPEELKKTRLAGRGPWRSSKGDAAGVITIAIDVKNQTFSATFRGGPGGSNVAYAGEFRGVYKGDDRAGALTGGGAVQIISRGKNVGSEPFRVSAQLKSGAVVGSAGGDGWAYGFSVPVN